MNILGMGPMELVLIVVLALIVFGPARLPEIMGQVGKAINDFRRATSELSDEFNRTIQAELQETRAVIDETKSAVTDAHASINSAVSGIPAPVRTAEPPEALPAPVADGISSEPHPEPFANGTVANQVAPPLADTSQWSWETAAPKPPASGEAGPATPAVAAPVDGHAPAQPSEPTPTAPSPSQERAARDELQPPY